MIDGTGVAPIACYLMHPSRILGEATRWRAIKCTTLTKTPSWQQIAIKADDGGFMKMMASLGVYIHAIGEVRAYPSFCAIVPGWGWTRMKVLAFLRRHCSQNEPCAAYVCDLLPCMQPTEQPSSACLQPGAPIRSRGLVIIAEYNLRDGIIAIFKGDSHPFAGWAFMTHESPLEIENVASKFCRW